MMGGGTGFAPLKSMIEYLLRKKSSRPIHLYWGARNLSELYCLDLPKSWETEFSHIQFTPVLSDPAAEDNWLGRSGFVHTAVIDDYPDLSAHEIYMSGPPIMIDTARHAFPVQGLPDDRLFYDSFEFGADVPFEILAEPH
jgi:CDP-4-dehydro-6-deoxyglucose reductase